MSILLIACGALARELITLRDLRGWNAKILALPVLLHNTPEKIPAAIRQRIEDERASFERVLVVYGDCGTGGMLDRLLAEMDIERIEGPHCYEQHAGNDVFTQMMDEKPGTYFLTDYLVQSFDHLVIESLGLDRFPELRDMYFGNYERVVYLQQRQNPPLL